MRIAMLRIGGREEAAVLGPRGYIPVAILADRFGTDWEEELLGLLRSGNFYHLHDWFRSGGAEAMGSLKGAAVLPEEACFAPLYRHPSKIWGIGLNYVDHAGDLAEVAPNTEPASFMKPDTAIIGYGETIRIPRQSERTTAEAELGVIFGRHCKDVEREDWLSVVAGFTTIIDMTAEDILRQNPRYLTRCKSFDTFFSFGPELVTPDELPDVMKLKVATIHNGRVHAENFVSNMTFPPDDLVSFHSRVMTMRPGDIISTGTPRAVPIAHGDRVECRIDGFRTLHNDVMDLKQANGKG